MPHLRFAAVAFAAALASPAFAADPVTGDWMLPSGAAKVRIAPCPADRAKMCGHVAWLKTPDVRDAKNPDPALRGRPVVGMMMIQDFKSAGPARWTEGKICPSSEVLGQPGCGFSGGLASSGLEI